MVVYLSATVAAMIELVLGVLACVLLCGVAGVPGPLIVTQQGTLRGTYGVTASGRTYSAYLGIPYTKPPVGKQRFKEPVAPKPWRGVWTADKVGSQCLNYDFYSNKVEGDEDCLYLNVYTPSTNGTELLDVVVNIHGGAFMMGSGDMHGPNYLLDRDVVLVTMNYRLGILGFFSTGDILVPGNNGLKDQVMSLQWVQKNIAAFGGDPARVTIVGTSAGGASVHMHYLSPLSKGLFHRGMSPSGTALNPWVQAEELKQKGEILAGLLGCPTYITKDMIDCLRHRPARAIVEKVTHFMVWKDFFPFAPWGPTVEIARPEAFLAEQPVDILMEGRMHQVPWITSVTSEEGLYPAAAFLGCPKLMEELAARWEELAALTMDWNATVAPGQRGTVAQRVKQFYLGDKPISQENSAQIIQMMGDRLFVVDGERAARMHASTSTAPVYFYEFSYRGKHSLSEVLSVGVTTNWGCSHGDDTAYAFDVSYAKTDETEQDGAMSRVMVDMYANFAQTGNPAPTEVVWEPIEPKQKQMAYLWIGSPTDIEMRITEDLGNRKFWDSLPIKEQQVAACKATRPLDEL